MDLPIIKPAFDEMMKMENTYSETIKKSNPLAEGLVYGNDFAIGDLKPGMGIVRLASRYCGRVSGKIIKVNRKTYDIESLYGGWGGQEPTPVQLRLRFDEPGDLLVRDGDEVHVVVI
jgi:hypothetical protein